MSVKADIEMLKALLHDGEAETPEKPAPVDSQANTSLHGENYPSQDEKQLMNWSGDPAEAPKSLKGYSYGAILRMWVDGDLSEEEQEWFSWKSPPGAGMPNLKLISMRMKKHQNT